MSWLTRRIRVNTASSQRDTLDTLSETLHDRPSFRGNSLARFAADVYGLLTSLIAATITARVLGPGARGFYATLVLLIVLFVQVFNAGLGEAAVVLAGKGRFALKTASQATTAAILPMSLGSALVFLAAATSILHPDSPNHRLAIVLASVAVFLNVLSTTIVWFLVAEERIPVVAALTAAGLTVSTLTLWLLMAHFRFNAAGAVLGTLSGLVVSTTGTLAFLRRAALPLAPRWNWDYLKAALKFGTAVQLSNILVQMTARLDLVLVYRLAGSTEAGNYSIALTVGALVTLAPMAFAFVSFPRLAHLKEFEARSFTTRLTRIGLASAFLSAVILAAATPLIIPILFGTEYTAAIGPTLVLIASGIFWSGQWLLARAAAAQGHTAPLFVSFSLSFVMMVILDIVLIPHWGMRGAAFAALVSSVVGLGVVARYYALSSWPLSGFLPRFSDAASMVTMLRDLVRSWRTTKTV